MTDNVFFVEFDQGARNRLRSDEFRVTSASKAERVVQRVMGQVHQARHLDDSLIQAFERLEKQGWKWCGGCSWKECVVSHREHTEGYMVGIAQAIDIQQRRDMRLNEPPALPSKDVLREYQQAIIERDGAK